MARQHMQSEVTYLLNMVCHRFRVGWQPILVLGSGRLTSLAQFTARKDQLLLSILPTIELPSAEIRKTSVTWVDLVLRFILRPTSGAAKATS